MLESQLRALVTQNILSIIHICIYLTMICILFICMSYLPPFHSKSTMFLSQSPLLLDRTDIPHMQLIITFSLVTFLLFPSK